MWTLMWSKIILYPKKDNFENAFLKPKYPFKYGHRLEGADWGDLPVIYQNGIVNLILQFEKSNILISDIMYISITELLSTE